MKRAPAVLAILLVTSLGASTWAAFRMSPTWDEIVLVSVGARAVETGDWSPLVDQPPVLPWIYGAQLALTGAHFPLEPGPFAGLSPEATPGGVVSPSGDERWSYRNRWEYSRRFYYLSGNDPLTVARISRTVGIVCLGVLGVLTFLYGSWMGGRPVGLLAATLVLFLPDAIAHGAVAYNDLPLALAFLASIWAIDVAARSRSPGVGAVAGALVALALGVKYSALALFPIGAGLLLLEFVGSSGSAPTVPSAPGAHDRPTRSLLAPVAAAILAGYAVTVALYGGDVLLIRLEQGLRFTIEHASQGHPAPAYLFGRLSDTGFWYYFPLAFLVKTPAALHVALPLAFVGLLKGLGGVTLRQLANSPLRGPVVGATVFGLFLLRSDLNIGFRYALPLLPLLLLVTAVGLVRVWRRVEGRPRAALAILLALYLGSTLSSGPWFLSYRSEWFRGLPPGREALIDSNLDWGQGLIALREWMDAEGVSSVDLSYFGSAIPSELGIEYEALPSHYPIRSFQSAGGADSVDPIADRSGTNRRPRYTVISATNLHGIYLDGDPFAAYRDRKPMAVLGGSLYVYDEGTESGRE